MMVTMTMTQAVARKCQLWSVTVFIWTVTAVKITTTSSTKKTKKSARMEVNYHHRASWCVLPSHNAHRHQERYSTSAMACSSTWTSCHLKIKKKFELREPLNKQQQNSSKWKKTMRPTPHPMMKQFSIMRTSIETMWWLT